MPEPPLWTDWVGCVYRSPVTLPKSRRDLPGLGMAGANTAELSEYKKLESTLDSIKDDP